MTKPSIMFAISTLSGGTPATNFDLMSALSHRYNCFLLVSNLNKVELFEYAAGAVRLVKTCAFRQSARIDRNSDEYTAALGVWLKMFSIRLLHIRHLAWHNMNLPAIAASNNVPVVLSFHDYYMICPNVKLMDNSGQYCAGICRGVGDCSQELWPSHNMPALKNNFVYEWRSICSEAITRAQVVVTTSRTAKRLFENFFGHLGKKILILPHGRDFPLLRTRGGKYFGNRPLRVLASNLTSSAKGLDFFRAVVENSDEKLVNFYLIGDIKRVPERNNLRVYGKYARDNFVRIASEIAPDIGFLPSMWPETYCHILTEMWASGLPVLGIKIGAVEERLTTHGGGWLLESADVPLAVQTIKYLQSDPDEINKETAAVEVIQKEVIEIGSVSQMACLYQEIYAKLV